jgi:hypothetical protein
VFWLIMYRFLVNNVPVFHSYVIPQYSKLQEYYITDVKVYNSLIQANGANCLSTCFCQKKVDITFSFIPPSLPTGRQTDTQTTASLM